MTTWPRLKLGNHLLPGLAAVALFAVLSAVFLTAEFGAPAAFPAGESIVASIGYALLGLDSSIPSERFLVAFIIIAIVLDAALDGSVMLAKREEAGEVVTALTDGGTDRAADADAPDAGDDREEVEN